MSGSVTYVKFMTREELVSMLEDIHRFEMRTNDGRRLILDKRLKSNRPVYFITSDSI